MALFSDYVSLFGNSSEPESADILLSLPDVNPTPLQLPNGRNVQAQNCSENDSTVLFRANSNVPWSTSTSTIPAGRTVEISIAPNTQYQLLGDNQIYRSAIYRSPAANLLPEQISFRNDVSSIGPCNLQIINTTVYNGFNQPLTLYTRYHILQPWYESGVTIGPLTTAGITVGSGFQLILASSRPANILIKSNNIVASNIYTLVPGYDGSTIYFLPDGSVRFGLINIGYYQSTNTSWWDSWWWVIVLVILLVLLIIAYIIWATRNNSLKARANSDKLLDDNYY